jgi:hypothetical protein
MPKGDVETFHEGGAWHNKIEGTSEVLGSYPVKAEAQAAGRTSSATSTGGSGNATPTATTPATSPADPSISPTAERPGRWE